MSEKEKRALEIIVTAIPKMSEFDKGYLLGKAESLIEETKKEEMESEPCING